MLEKKATLFCYELLDDETTDIFTPHVCGNKYEDGKPLTICWRYVADRDKWLQSGKLSEGRQVAAAASHPTTGIYFAGDWNDYELSSVEYTKDGNGFSSIPPMPEPRKNHCLAIVGKDLFVAGGFGRRSTLYEKAKNECPGPLMRTSRRGGGTPAAK
jgi:hypothetical protein